MTIDKLNKLDAVLKNLRNIDYNIKVDENGFEYITSSKLYAKKEFLESFKKDLNEAIKDVKIRYEKELKLMISNELDVLKGELESE